MVAPGHTVVSHTTYHQRLANAATACPNLHYCQFPALHIVCRDAHALHTGHDRTCQLLYICLCDAQSHMHRLAPCMPALVVQLPRTHPPPWMGRAGGHVGLMQVPPQQALLLLLQLRWAGRPPCRLPAPAWATCTGRPRTRGVGVFLGGGEAGSSSVSRAVKLAGCTVGMPHALWL